MKKIFLTATCLCLFILIASGAGAATYINPAGGGNGSEPSLIAPGGILDSLYGLQNLTRVSDERDQYWRVVGEIGEATFKAKNAYFSQRLGFTDSNGSAAIFSVPPSPLPGTKFEFRPTGDFVFVLDPNGQDLPGAVFSLEGLNQSDQMVAWRINGTDDYVIAWEDMISPSDRDFNDLVVELSDVQPVPEPATLVLIGTGLASMIGFKRRRK